MTSFQWCHHNNITEKRHQNNATKFFHFGPPPNQNFWLRQCWKLTIFSGVFWTDRSKILDTLFSKWIWSQTASYLLSNLTTQKYKIVFISNLDIRNDSIVYVHSLFSGQKSQYSTQNLNRKVMVPLTGGPGIPDNPDGPGGPCIASCINKVANFASACKYLCFKNCLMFNFCSSLVWKKKLVQWKKTRLM